MDDGEGQWLPYPQRPEWSDVVPAAVDDAGGPVLAIQYSQQHKELLGYFRAVVEKGERSARVLDLTADLIRSNSADYSAWQYRWDTLLALQADLSEEVGFTRRIADECAKNYQLWNHQRKLAKALGPAAAEAELQFCTGALDDDAKNYHAWAHRQVAVAAAGAWQQELRYTERLLQEDVRNNSAWNQRFFVLQHTLEQHSSLQELLDAELDYIATKVAAAPDNESAWNYLSGLATLPGCSTSEMARQPKVYVICREALSDQPSCKPALDMLALYYHWLAAAAAEQQDVSSAFTAARHGMAVLDKAAVADPIRDMHWQHRRQQLQQLLDGLQAAPAASGSG